MSKESFSTETINLLDIVDLAFLQKIQDAFANAANVASIIVDANGAITAPSNFTVLVDKYIKKDYAKIHEEWGKKAAVESSPEVFTNPVGLIDFVVPIVIKGHHLATILGGQVLTEVPDEDCFRQIAIDNGFNEQAFLEDLKEINIVSQEQIKYAIDLLFVVANSISEMAQKNLELEIQHKQELKIAKKAADRELLLRKVNETIRDTLDINNTFTLVCKELANLFDVQRVLITQFNNQQDLEYFIRKEYKARPELVGLDVRGRDLDTAKYWGKLAKEVDSSLLLRDISNSSFPDCFKKSYQAIGVKSLLCSSIKKGSDRWGTIVLLDYDKQRDWSSDDVEFINTISDQIYMFIQQAELYLSNNKQAQRELLIRKVSENIRSSLDINKTLSYVCDELAKVFNVQRATIIQYHNKENYSEFEVRREYKSDSSIKGILNNPDFNFRVGEIWAKALEGDGKFLAIDNIEESDLPQFFKDNYKTIGQKSIIIAPIEKDSLKWGVIILSEYNYYRHWTDEDINLLKTISNQIYIAIKQSELYDKVRETAEQEKVLRKIISSSVNNFDGKEVIKSVIKEAGQLFGADRCVFVEYDFREDASEVLKDYNEYLSSDSVPSVASSLPGRKILDAIVKKLKKREVLYSQNVENERLMQETRRMLVDDLRVKSYLVAPVYFGDTDYGSIVLHYVKEYKQFLQEDIDLIKSIASQTAAVIHQAKLYSTIEKNEKYTRTVLNNIQDAIVTVDEEYIIQTCNPAVEFIWGYAPEDCIGKPLDMLLNYNCDCDDKTVCLLQKSVYGRKDTGESFPVEINLSNVILDSKRNILLVIRDITERKRIEQMKNEFVSTVSHELRTPLTSIRGSLGLVISGKMGDLSDKIKSLLDIANNNSLRLINLINDILDIEKIEAGKMDFELVPLDIVPIVQYAIQSNIQYAQKFGVEIDWTEHVGSAVANIDKDRLIQVVTNLLSNAIKFADSKLPVKVSIERVDKNIRVSVTNYGSEIAEEFRNRIFQKFAQGDSSDSRQKGGTGLGLSISKSIVEKLNGYINFKSENNQTTFYFDLPEVFGAQ